MRWLASLALLAACATGDDVVDPADPDLPEEAAVTEAASQVQFVPEGTPSPNRTSCEANGPCDPGCDQGLINELFVPHGTCIIITCQANGDTWLTGGCRD